MMLSTRPATTGAAWAGNERTGAFATTRGEIEYLVQGSGPTLIALHGIQSSMIVWHRVMQYLTGINVVTLNMPGRGRSARWPAETQGCASHLYSVDAFAHILHEVIQQIPRPVALAGWSMGAAVALRYIELYGCARLRRLWLISGLMVPRDGVNTFSGTCVDDVMREALLREKSFNLQGLADPLAVAHTWLSMQTLDFRETVAGLQIPTTVVHGTGDPECPFEQSIEMAEISPLCCLLPIEGAGHFLLSEHSEAIAYSIASGRTNEEKWRLTP